MNNPTRILQVVTTMDLGGAETFLMNLYRNMDREKVQFDFLCHNRLESAYAEEIQRLGGRMYCLPGMSHVGFFHYRKNLYLFFKEHPEYKTVHCHQSFLDGVILQQAKQAGIPNRFAHSHSTFTFKPGPRKWIFEFFQLFQKNSITRAFSCAREAGKSLYRYSYATNFEVIPNAIETERFCYDEGTARRLREENKLGNSTLIGHVGRFIELKNHDFLLDVFNEYLNLDPTAKLVLIGQGDLMKPVQEKAESLGIANNVLFLGARTDVADWLKTFDLFLFPSHSEGLSVACVEAQAAGLPVLTSDMVSDEVCLTDLVYQESLDKSAREWAEKAQEMIHASSPEKRPAYADAVRRAGFDVHDVAAYMQRVYLGEE